MEWTLAEWLMSERGRAWEEMWEAVLEEMVEVVVVEEMVQVVVAEEMVEVAVVVVVAAVGEILSFEKVIRPLKCVKLANLMWQLHSVDEHLKEIV